MLEARGRVGGRTLNEPIGGGKVVEIGGQWVGPGQKRVLALIAELGLETFPTFVEGRNLFERRGRIRGYQGRSPGSARWPWPRPPPRFAASTRWPGAIDPERPWAAAKAESWDSQTFATWMRRNVRTPTARDLMRLAIWAVWAAEPEDVSLLSVLFYIRSAGSFEALIDTEGGAQEARVVGGSQAISLRMAEELEDRVVLDAPVRRIEHARGIVTVSTAGGSRSRRGGRSSPCRRCWQGGSSTTRRCLPSATGSPSGWRWAAWSSAWRSTRSRSGAPRASRGRRPAPTGRSR